MRGTGSLPGKSVCVVCTQDVGFEGNLKKLGLHDYYDVLRAEGYTSLDKVRNLQDLLDIGLKRADARLLFDTAGVSSGSIATPGNGAVHEQAKQEADSYGWEKAAEEVEEYNEERARRAARLYGTRLFVKDKKKPYSDSSLYRWCKLVQLAQEAGLDLADLESPGRQRSDCDRTKLGHKTWATQAQACSKDYSQTCSQVCSHQS